jgi:hypothetical protein
VREARGLRRLEIAGAGWRVWWSFTVWRMCGCPPVVSVNPLVFEMRGAQWQL